MEDLKTTRNNSVKSILKAFSIMEEIDKKAEMSIAEISENLKMDRGTVHRLLTTMKDAGYVMQNPDNKKYSNGLKLFAMGNRAVEKMGVKHIARPYMEKLAADTNETVNLGIRVANEIVYIDKIESNSTIKVGIEIGTSIPDYCTGMGKAVLAFLPDLDKSKILKNTEFKLFAQKTIKGIESLEANLKTIRENGFSEDDEEFVDGLISFGAPIFDYHGKPIAAISVSFPKYRYAENNVYIAFPKKVMESALAISNQLGYNLK